MKRASKGLSAWFGVLALCLVAPAAQTQQVFPAWIGLFQPDDLEWLENENRIRELCPDPAREPRCYFEKLAPRVSVSSLHSGPAESSPSVGDLIVVATPGRGWSAHFRPAGSDQVVGFIPDLFLVDWGYGPYFHQTMVARRGEWYQLPPGPWESAVWVHRPSESRSPTDLAITEGEIVEWNGSGWFVVAAEPEALLLRPEQPADMWCQEGNPPAIIPTEPQRFTRADLADSRGHLLLRPKYPKGC